MKEIRDLLDKNRKLTGEVIETGEIIPNGKYISIVIIWIENEKEEILIQKRSRKKDGKLSSTGGHLIAGETSLEGILREVKEELGIHLNEKEIELISSKKTDDTFVDIYYTKKEIEIGNLVLQEEEVEKVKWSTVIEIEKMLKEGTFLKTHYDCLKECKYYQNQVKEYLNQI